MTTISSAVVETVDHLHDRRRRRLQVDFPGSAHWPKPARPAPSARRPAPGSTLHASVPFSPIRSFPTRASPPGPLSKRPPGRGKEQLPCPATRQPGKVVGIMPKRNHKPLVPATGLSLSMRQIAPLPSICRYHRAALRLGDGGPRRFLRAGICCKIRPGPPAIRRILRLPAPCQADVSTTGCTKTKTTTRSRRKSPLSRSWRSSPVSWLIAVGVVVVHVRHGRLQPRARHGRQLHRRRRRRRRRHGAPAGASRTPSRRRPPRPTCPRRSSRWRRRPRASRRFAPPMATGRCAATRRRAPRASSAC